MMENHNYQKKVGFQQSMIIGRNLSLLEGIIMMIILMKIRNLSVDIKTLIKLNLGKFLKFIANCPSNKVQQKQSLIYFLKIPQNIIILWNFLRRWLRLKQMTQGVGSLCFFLFWFSGYFIMSQIFWQLSFIAQLDPNLVGLESWFGFRSQLGPSIYPSSSSSA